VEGWFARSTPVNPPPPLGGREEVVRPELSAFYGRGQHGWGVHARTAWRV